MERRKQQRGVGGWVTEQLSLLNEVTWIGLIEKVKSEQAKEATGKGGATGEENGGWWSKTLNKKTWLCRALKALRSSFLSE